MAKSTWFTRVAKKTAQFTGRPIAFGLAARNDPRRGSITGPIFDYSDTWQLDHQHGHHGHHLPHGVPDPEHAEPRHRGHPDQARRADPRVRGAQCAHGSSRSWKESELEQFRKKYQKLAAAARKKIKAGDLDIDSPGYRMKAHREETAMRFPIALLIASLALPAFAADELPRFRTGLWEFKRSVDGGDGKPVTLTNQKCTNPTEDMKKKTESMAQSGCQVSPMS